MENHSSTHAQAHTSYNFDAVPRVSIDGEPHEMLTLVTCLSGLVVATILVSVIVFMLRKVHKTEWHHMKTLTAQPDVEAAITQEQQPQKVKIFTIFGSTKQSFDLSSTSSCSTSGFAT